MPPPKRRTRGGLPVDDTDLSNTGRSETSDSDRVHGPQPHASQRTFTPRDRVSSPKTASGRYTPPIKATRFRPSWHRWIGVGLLVVGVLVIALNDVMLLQPDLTLLFGGHNELYLIAGVAGAAYATWWFGWFDRKT